MITRFVHVLNIYIDLKKIIFFLTVITAPSLSVGVFDSVFDKLMRHVFIPDVT